MSYLRRSEAPVQCLLPLERFEFVLIQVCASSMRTTSNLLKRERHIVISARYSPYAHNEFGLIISPKKILTHIDTQTRIQILYSYQLARRIWGEGGGFQQPGAFAPG